MVKKNPDYLETRIKRLKAENKSLRETLLLLRKDILNLKRHLRDRDRLFNLIPAGVMLIRNGKILEINEQMLENLGYKAEEVIGRDFLDFIHQDEEEYVRRLHNIWNSGKMAPGQYDAHLITRGGGSIYCDVKVRRIRFKGRTAFLLNLNRLEKWEEMAQEKVRSSKGEALITMAHGVNARIRHINDLILKKIKESKEITRSGNMVAADAYSMLKDLSYKTMPIVRELELIGETGEGQRNATHFDINETVNEAVESFIEKMRAGPECHDNKIDLKTYLRSSSMVEGDPGEIKDVIISMINNAVEAMPDGGEIHITTEDNADYSHIYIQDSGIGIPSRFRERIFDPFFSTKGDEAEGLGLSLSYAIVRRHKGDIEMSSREGEGTIFHIRLPIAGNEFKARKAVKRKIRDAQVLIIQEEDVVRDLLSHLLIGKGCRVETASNGLEAMSRLNRKRFDLVMADVEALPDGGSAIVKRCVKADPKMSIALIRDRNDNDKNLLQGQLAVDLTIMRPIDVNTVLKQVSELLMNRS
ncbi:MAG TPA: ATP-binding protein [Desulfatiglandales bacterium]|nr:ATP-binding protein [Desulfatiglandales bacterium]